LTASNQRAKPALQSYNLQRIRLSLDKTRSIQQHGPIAWLGQSAREQPLPGLMNSWQFLRLDAYK
jgi:hypothetical protein